MLTKMNPSNLFVINAYKTLSTFSAQALKIESVAVINNGTDIELESFRLCFSIAAVIFFSNSKLHEIRLAQVERAVGNYEK